MGWMTCLGWKFLCTTFSNWHPTPFTWWSSTRGVAISSGTEPWGSSSTWTESLCLSGNSTSGATLGPMKSEFATGEGESQRGTPKITSFACKTTLFPQVRFRPKSAGFENTSEKTISETMRKILRHFTRQNKSAKLFPLIWPCTFVLLKHGICIGYVPTHLR